MRLAVVISLLLSYAVNAQTVSSNEHSFGPYARPRAGSTPAIVASRSGVLLAWSETDAATGLADVHFALLDFNGRLASEIATVPKTSSTQAFAPLIASDGETFLLVWAEESQLTFDDARSLGMRIDASGRPATGPISYSVQNPLWVGWDESQYILGVDGGSEVRIARDGVRMGSFGNSPGIPVNGARVIASSGVLDCYFFFCGPDNPIFEVKWTIDGMFGSRWFQYGMGSLPEFSGDGSRFLIAWTSPRGVEAILATRTRQLTSLVIPAVTDKKTSPSVAFDGAHYLVTWFEQAGVFGALVDPNGFEGHPFPIATTDRREKNPHAYVLREGRFLVVYDSDADGDLRFAGRIVSTEPPRRRAIH